ncbi:hypothetical protein SAMN05421505_12077 [Sinosporangium album]|uniref:Uncharacterized protein n=2 Tax=Sinosporangium album TaxID=504805 RepID=A0A1G8EFI1_9ACTN|nr:hypothetical protein SAMN05421505_12077 [Sinosporangium album]
MRAPGYNFGGTRVSGVGDGTEPDDAVNKSQLDAGVASRVPADSTITADPAAPMIIHRRNFTIDLNSQEVMQVWVNGVKTMALNEWGALRVQSPFSWDAGARFIGHPTQSGNVVEYQNNTRNATLWGITKDGNTYRNGVVMAPVLVLAVGDPVPAGTPVGTVILRK